MRGYSQYWADIWKLRPGYDQQGPGEMGNNYNLYTTVIYIYVYVYVYIEEDKSQDETI